LRYPLQGIGVQSIFTSTLHRQMLRIAAFLEEKQRQERLLCTHQK
jgi:hypothetical protein